MTWTTDMNLLSWMQMVALALAGLFFLVKLAQGWLMVNLTLAPTLERRRSAHHPEFDDLAVTVTLTKGGNGSVRIQDTAVRVMSGDSIVAEGELAGTSRLEIRSDGSYRLRKPWTPLLRERRNMYRLPPGEGTVWSASLTGAPAGSVCVVEIVVLGRQWPTPAPAQWRCSAVSLPLDDAGRSSP